MQLSFSAPMRFFIVIVMTLLLLSPLQAQETDMLASLTLKQKVAQMFMVSLYGTQLTEVGQEFLQEWQPGGISLFGYNIDTPESTTRLINAFQQTVVDAGGQPMLAAIDQEGGIIERLQVGFTNWPVSMLITATGDETLGYRVGEAIAQELRAVGVNMDLAPVADLYTNRNNPVIGRRSFGSDPQLTGQAVASVVRGLQAGGVLSTAKHFPGHGDTDVDSHAGLPVVQHDRERLETVEITPFRMAIENGVEAVMVAHIWLPALEPEENIPASLSANVVTGLLRDELGYDGLIMVDALDMDAIDTLFSPDEAVIRAINAGVDVLAFGSHPGLENQWATMQAVVDAVQRGDITEERIDASVRRILAAKQQYGILDWQPLEAEITSDRIDLEAHAALIDELFQAGTTLVFDQHDSIPLVDETIAVFYPANRPQIRAACESYSPSIRTLGVSDSPTEEDISWALDYAWRADKLVVFTQNADQDRQQQALVNALPPEKTIVVALWSPFDVEFFSDVSAYLTTYSPLEPGVAAACAILFGAAPARGQLPVTINADLPAGMHD